MTITLKAQSPADLLSLIPHLLRFHVDDGVVIIVCSRRTVELAARFDHALVAEPEHLRATLDQLHAHVPRGRLFIAAFGQRACAETSLDILQGMLHPREIIDLVYCDGQHWWSRLCLDDCCQGVPHETDSAVAVEAAVRTGSRPLASRRELEAMVAGPSLVEQADQLGALSEAIEHVEAMTMPQRRERMLRQVRDFIADPARELDPEEALEMAVLAGHIPARDEAWLEMSAQQARRHVELWARVVQVTPDRHAVAPLCLLGCAGWLQGNGALLGIAIERARRLDPDYSMLSILMQVHAGMANPALWEQVRTGVG